MIRLEYAGTYRDGNPVAGELTDERYIIFPADEPGERYAARQDLSPARAA